MIDEPLLSLQNAAKIFAARRRWVRAFGPLDFEVRHGERVAIVGRSGAGKSTLALCLAGLEPLSTGTRRFAPPAEAAQLVFQDSPSALNPAWSVADLLMEPLRLARHADANTERDRLLLQVGLTEDLLARRPDQLSGGQRRRLAIARALAVPGLRILILDEPFAGLDLGGAAPLCGLLNTLQAERNLALILITHDLNSVERLADRVAVMAQGAIVEELPASRFLAAAQHPESHALIAAILPGAPL